MWTASSSSSATGITRRRASNRSIDTRWTRWRNRPLAQPLPDGASPSGRTPYGPDHSRLGNPVRAICCTGGTTRSAPPVFLVTLVRVLYLIMGYFIVSLVCCLCNYRYRFIGGVEFESQNVDA